MLAQLLDASVGEDMSSTKWLDAEGSSLIRTLGKAWGGDAPFILARLFEGLVLRHFKPTAGSEVRPAASQTCSLAVAYILPTLLKYSSFTSSLSSADMHTSSLHFIPAAAMPDCEAEGCICQFQVRIMECPL